MEDLRITDDQVAFRASAVSSFQACDSLGNAQALRRLGDDGLPGMLVSAASGGLEIGLFNAVPVLEAAGAERLSVALAEAMLAAQCLERWHSDRVAPIVSGAEIATIAWQADLSAGRDVEGWRIRGTLSHVSGLKDARWLLAPVSVRDIDHQGARGLALIDLRSADLVYGEDPGLDLERPAHHAVIDATVEKDRLQPGDEAARLAMQGSVLLCAEMVGAADAAHDAAVQYTALRRQFGKPLSAFQAVRHALARDEVALQGARRMVLYAALAQDDTAPDAMKAQSAMAAIVPDYCKQIVESSMHLHGAMGFTFDMPLHRWVRRVKALSAVVSGYCARAALADVMIG